MKFVWYEDTPCPMQAPSRSVGTPITNLTANPAGPLSSAYLPLSNAIITSGDTKVDTHSTLLHPFLQFTSSPLILQI